MQARLASGNKLRVRNGKVALAPAFVVPPPALIDLQGGAIGQSNMFNMPKTGNIYPLGAAGTTAYSRTEVWQRIGHYNDARPAGEQANLGAFTAAYNEGGGPMSGDGFVFLANAIRAAANVPVRMIERAVSGSAIASWIDGPVGNNWDAFAAAVTAAGGGLDFVIWYQGETDAHNLNPTTHIAALNTLYQQCLTLSGRTADKFHFGVIALGVGSFNGSTEGEFGAMRALLVDWANSTPGVFFASSAHDSFTNDGVHNVGSGGGRIGNRAGKSLAARLGFGVTAAGPRISGATRSGTAVTLAIAHTGGTAMRDAAGGTTGTALTGFEFKDAGAGGATISYTTAFVGGNIVCTLASAPVGVLTVSYAMANTPHGASSTVAPVFASIPCDNVSYQAGTYGAPLQPMAAITVT